MTHIKVTGSPVAKNGGGYRKAKLIAHEAIVHELVQMTSDDTLDEFVITLAQLGVTTRRPSLDRYFDRIGWSFKNLCTQPHKIGQTSKTHVKSGARNIQRFAQRA